MAKEIIKAASLAGIQKTLETFLPDFRKRMETLDHELRSLRKEMHDEIRVVDAKVDNLRTEMLDKFQDQLGVINEINGKIIKLEGKVEGYMELLSLFVPSPRGTRKRAV